MNAALLGLLAETSIHPGAGQSAGFVDLPVAREAATDYPVIVGSSVKGALRDMARQLGKDDEQLAEQIFGKQEHAGQLLVSDARLAMLPVRSLSSSFRWVTCPHLLERLARDQARAGASVDVAEGFAALRKLTENSALGKKDADEPFLFLEERQFQLTGDVPAEIIALVEGLIAHTITRSSLKERLVVVSDDDFAWFARYGLAINARNQLDVNTKESKNLWYEETLPPDSLFYVVLAERSTTSNALEQTLSWFKARPYVQMGGNETVGQGWFAVKSVVKGGQ
ncbi:type III-B CRISPR module RAMP protein Cmr4 [Lujinxingia vulgaris]|uniref:Type III-B CRISPR module RAMP protein Cmr4 n=1 Tax=Lujinxingia vulgaris TaxID=2600176 RepID=A0A5C6X9X0_9DELT|nr:type III-B CRISPR module RAMP protein Cmr4 [Lujinxingia vulgaris]TXD34082.1 type III-B CRISPR module RAMP protein Cmr4 [Lujinxingia vulgaris]